MPPRDLVLRVGTPASDDPFTFFESLGRAERKHLLRLLPDDWSFEGKRMLDFGCGAGRTLRHLLDEAAVGELWGCDIDAPSIAWLDEHLAPPLRVFVNDEEPPLPFEDESLDLVFALSVFSHLAESWSRWLVELHRVLRDDALLIVTFHGRGTWPLGIAGKAGVPFDDDGIGMHVEHYGDGFDTSWGPAVYLSEWWLREHWGRAFDIASFEAEGFPTADPSSPNRAGQSTAVLRKRPGSVSPSELERPGTDSRELAAVLRSRELVYRELAAKSARLRGEIRRLSEVVRAHQREIQRLTAASQAAKKPKSRRFRR